MCRTIAGLALIAAVLLAACASPPTAVPQPTPIQAVQSPTASPAAQATVQLPTVTLAPTATPLPAVPAPSVTPGPLGPTTLGRAENFVELGHADLGARGWNAGLALAYPCAYVGNRRLPQIAIVDVSDPASPSLAGDVLLAPGSQPIELRAAPDLNLLIVLNFSPDLSVLAFDTTDCLHPQPLGSLGLGAVPHEFFLWRDLARPGRLLLYIAMFRYEDPDLMVVDVSDPSQPRILTRWSARAEGAAGRLHSLSVSADGRRAYLALWDGGFLIADTSAVAEGAADPEIRLIRPAAGPPAPAPGSAVHSAVLLRDGRHVLLTQEVYACPFAGLLIADAADEARPQVVGRFDLPENMEACAGLPQADAVFTAHNPLLAGDLAFVTWYGGGLQALDLSDPARPSRVGLFVPRGVGAARASYVGSYPVQLWSYPILRDGLLYVSDIQSGLYVLRYTGPGAEAVAGVAWAEANASGLP